MNDTERQQLAARVLEHNRAYESLEANPDFQEWRENGPLAEIALLKDKIADIDRGDPDWKEKACGMIAEYQGLSRVYESLFRINLEAALKAREVVKNQRRPS